MSLPPYIPALILIVSPDAIRLNASFRLFKGETSSPSFVSFPALLTHQEGPLNFGMILSVDEPVPIFPSLSTAATLKKYSEPFVNPVTV